ncbi:MAG: hypothetical protein DRQ65_02965 [Gammaproteobacteria bacterium]|nr:MAG: hypothetical protein DRQ98_06980 [Gammaproteobacteria bacterium]RLA56523.1 MAG: hypothetical protein DRQ65_02965 [Gammaproteobacteria bacterium]HDY82641.1 hypothetical protein [Halieaceae bacterium]
MFAFLSDGKYIGCLSIYQQFAQAVDPGERPGGWNQNIQGVLNVARSGWMGHESYFAVLSVTVKT